MKDFAYIIFGHSVPTISISIKGTLDMGEWSTQLERIRRHRTIGQPLVQHATLYHGVS